MNKLIVIFGIAVASLSGLMGFFGSHYILSSKLDTQRIKYEKVLSDYREQARISSELKQTIEQGFREAAKKARDDAEQAKAISTANFNSLNRALGGMRNDFDRTSKAISGANRASVDQFAGVTGRLLSTCMEEYVWLGERANKHRIDLIEHRAAWPKYQKSGP